MKTYKPHPAAELVPMMKPVDLKTLAGSIIERGQKLPIILLGGKVIDGRNRLAACEMAGVEPKTMEWPDEDASPAELVDLLNDKRRHLTQSQRAALAADLIPLFQAEARQRRGKKSAPGRSGYKAAAAAAVVKGAKVRTVERFVSVQKADPKLAQAVREGEITVKQAEKRLKRKKQVEQAHGYEAPSGEYPVIVVDPPWPYEDQLDGSDAARGGTPYPSMTIGDICELELSLATDAAVFLWVTNSHLIDPEAYAKVAEIWKHLYGLVPKQIRTWVKPRMGLGRYWRNDTEHLVLFVRGRPTFAPVTQTTSLNAPVGAHSAKPAQAFVDIIEMCPSTPRLELFARERHDGFVSSGAELLPLPSPKKRKLTIRDVPPEPGAVE